MYMYEANHYTVYGFNIPIPPSILRYPRNSKNLLVIAKVLWSLNQATLVHTSPCTHKLGWYTRTLRPGKAITSTRKTLDKQSWFRYSCQLFRNSPQHILIVWIIKRFFCVLRPLNWPLNFKLFTSVIPSPTLPPPPTESDERLVR